jgi:carbon storage regulator
MEAMLVLTRGEGEQIRIGENVIVTINRVKGKAVQVGIDAPSSIEIVRRELDLDGTEPTDIISPDELEDGE